MDDSLQQIFSKDMDEELKKAGLDDMQTQLKKTKLVFSVKFDTKVYISDTQAGIQSITVDGKEISKQQRMDIGEDGKLVTYYSMKSFKEGKHTLTAKDKLGNTVVLSFNLDKTAPTVRGVKNKGVYKKTVMVKVSDKSGIQSIKLNGKSIKSGKRITKKGAYKLVAIDKAGNKKVMRFIIKR